MLRQLLAPPIFTSRMTDPSDLNDLPTSKFLSRSHIRTLLWSQVSWSEWILSWFDRHRRKLFLILVVYYLAGFNAQWRVEPDSALYLSVGRNLAEGRGFTYNDEPHRLAFPGAPLLFAGVFKLCHPDHLKLALQASLVLMLLIGASVLALMYRLFLLFANRPTAVLMTFGLGISRLFYRYCFELLSDMPFLLGVMAFLVGHEAIFQRRKSDSAAGARWFDWVLLAGGLGIAIATRPSMWALLAAIVLALIWSLIRGPVRWPQVFICLGVAAVAAGALFWRFGLGNASDSSMKEYEEALFHVKFTHIGDVFHTLVFENIPRLFNPTLSQALFGARLDPVSNVLVGAAAIIVSATMLLDRPLWFFWVAMTFAMMLVAIEPLDRYFLEALPLMVFAWWRGIKWLNDRFPKPWANWLFLVLFLFGALTNMSHTIEFIIEQRRVPFLNSYKEGRHASQDAVASLIHNHVDEKGWVLTSARFARILAFLSHRKVVGPSSLIVQKLRRNDFYVLEPIQSNARQVLQGIHMETGPQVGPEVKSKFDPEPWQLHRAVPFSYGKMFYDPESATP